MEIRNSVYEALTPVQLVVASYAAIHRGDEAEANRLAGKIRRAKGGGKALLGVSQALEVYNAFSARTMKDFLLASGKADTAGAYCEGWLNAGGSVDDAAYLRQKKEMNAWVKVALSKAGELEAVKQATREWCEQYGVVAEIFTSPMAFLPLTQTTVADVAADQATLLLLRDLFSGIALKW
jgi:hypothetical protein